jgi:hypothetical protein
MSSAVEAALANLRPSLLADGFDLYTDGEPREGMARVVLEAGAQACLDCLTPDEIMRAIILDAVRERDDSIVDVILIKRGFDRLEDL